MPRADRRTYPVVTSTIVAIALAAVGIRIAKPLLPPDPPNRLVEESADFLQQGAHQQVDWRIVSKDAFEEAAAKKKLVLLLIGASWSELGRIADKEVFSDPDVEALIAKHFIPVRIDVQDQPQWMSAILPLNRSEGIRDPGFQIYFLDSSGRIFGDAGQIGFSPPLNSIEFANLLQSAIGSYLDFDPTKPDSVSPGEVQARQEIALLDEPNARQTGIDYQRTKTLERISKRPGLGFSQVGTGQMRPSALRYLLRTGQFDAFRAAVTPFVTGGLADWLDGGFFEQVRFSGRQETSFDKRVRANAEMMEVFAEAYCVLKDPIFKQLARRTFLWIFDDMSPDGIPLVARIGDELPNGRSARSSISVAQLRDSLQPADLEFARNAMGLRVETNPMMTIRVADPTAILADLKKFDRIIATFRSKLPVNTQRIGPKSCDVAAFAAARLTRTALLLDDTDLEQRAESTWSSIQVFSAGADVVRRIESTSPESPILADYLAFADACLQRFLSNHDLNAFEHGKQVLTRASFLFQDRPGIWLPGGPIAENSGVQIQPIPEILDTVRESESAQAIRLCWAYGTIAQVRKPGDASARQLIESASATRNHFLDDLESIAFVGSGYFNASATIDLNAVAYSSIRSDPQEIAALKRNRPQALVFEVDVEASDGIFVKQRDQIVGPLSLQKATELLAPMNP